jgi:RNA polymerase sigma-70 factor, ECF subfamily
MTAPVDSAERFTDLALPYSTQLYGTALRLTGNRADAEDLVQDTYLRAYAGFGTFEPGTSLKAWLYRIEANVFRSAYRARQRHPHEVPVDSVSGAVMSQAVRVLSAEEAAIVRMPDTTVVEALRGLPHEQMVTVYLADAEGYHYAEIAERTGVPLGTVMSRLHRGRKRLRSRLAGQARKSRRGPVDSRRRTTPGTGPPAVRATACPP